MRTQTMNSGFSTYACGGLVEKWSFGGKVIALEASLGFGNLGGAIWRPAEPLGMRARIHE
jgi:hypothetical protein